MPLMNDLLWNKLSEDGTKRVRRGYEEGNDRAKAKAQLNPLTGRAVRLRRQAGGAGALANRPASRPRPREHREQARARAGASSPLGCQAAARSSAPSPLGAAQTATAHPTAQALRATSPAPQPQLAQPPPPPLGGWATPPASAPRATSPAPRAPRPKPQAPSPKPQIPRWADARTAFFAPTPQKKRKNLRVVLISFCHVTPPHPKKTAKKPKKNKKKVYIRSIYTNKLFLQITTYKGGLTNFCLPPFSKMHQPKNVQRFSLVSQ